MQPFIVIVALVAVASVDAFVSSRLSAKPSPRVAPVNENFFLDIAEDPAINTPKQIFGEAAYKSFVESYDPEALLIGGPKYNIVQRVRQLKLLTVTAESGLLEALEAKGLTLSQVEKLLPVVDSLGLLPFLSKNKELLLSVAPLLIEPAPALLPILVSVLKTPASTFSTTGFALLAAGAYETVSNTALFGAPLVLLGLPLVVLGSVLSGSVSLPIPNEPVASFESAPVVKSSRPSASARPSIATRSAKSSSKAAAVQGSNGQRKTIKIRAKK
jgi:hypothetical protein